MLGDDVHGRTGSSPVTGARDQPGERKTSSTGCFAPTVGTSIGTRMVQGNGVIGFVEHAVCGGRRRRGRRKPACTRGTSPPAPHTACPSNGLRRAPRLGHRPRTRSRSMLASSCSNSPFTASPMGSRAPTRSGSRCCGAECGRSFRVSSPRTCSRAGHRPRARRAPRSLTCGVEDGRRSSTRSSIVGRRYPRRRSERPGARWSKQISRPRRASRSVKVDHRSVGAGSA